MSEYYLKDLYGEFIPRLLYYRMDGSAYPPGDAGRMEFAQDFNDFKGRIVGQDTLWTGIWLSTVWLGIDHNYTMKGPPIIFETMAFDHLFSDTDDLGTWRYSTLREAEEGHKKLKKELSSPLFVIRRCWELLLTEFFEDKYWRY